MIHWDTNSCHEQLTLQNKAFHVSQLENICNLKVLWRRGVIQLTRGVRSSVWSGFEPSHGSITARVEASIS